MPDGSICFALFGAAAAVPHGRAVVLGGAATAYLAWRFRNAPRARWRDLHAEQSGMSVATDLVLVAPIFLFLMLLILQWAILLKDGLLLHQAAYIAARSAKAHLCPNLLATAELTKMRLLGGLPCTDDKGKPLDAARYVMIGGAPYGEEFRRYGAGPGGAISALASGTDTTQNLRAWRDETDYAYEGPNTQAEVRLDSLVQALSGKGTPGEASAHAEISFRHNLLPWMEFTFGSGRLEDGTAYSLMQAHADLR